MDPRAALAALADDEARGAGEITHQARKLLARLPEDADLADGQGADGAAREAVLALVQAHPSMAPIVHLADETLTLLETRGPEGLAQLPRSPSPSEQIAREARPAFAAVGTVLTYSRSGTVLAALEALLADRDLRVLTSEARPGGEGLGLARRLHEAGATVTVTYDAHLPALVEAADAVLVGADAITEDVFVNKAGTRTLLQRAREAGTSAYVLASRDKLWPNSLPHPPTTDVEAEAWLQAPEGVHIQAPLFERVPLALVDHLVTEEGVHDPSDVGAQARRREVLPDVVEALDKAPHGSC